MASKRRPGWGPGARGQKCPLRPRSPAAVRLRERVWKLSPHPRRGRVTKGFAKMHQPAARGQSLTPSRMACVRKWPGLDPHAKLAWSFLWYRAGERPGTVTVHQSEIGLDQGVAFADRSGRKALESLRKAQLIHVNEHAGGNWTFYLIDPIELQEAILRVAKPDPQPQLFEDHSPAPLPIEDATELVSLPIESASATPRARRTEGYAEGDDAAEKKTTAASATRRASPPCKNKTITTTNHNPICARGFSQSQDKAAGATATPRAHPKMPTAEEKVAMQSAQREREGADPPTISDP